MKFVITEKLVRETGGAFHLSSLLQKRLRELVRGAPRLIQEKGLDDFELGVREVEKGYIKSRPESREIVEEEET